MFAQLGVLLAMIFAELDCAVLAVDDKQGPSLHRKAPPIDDRFVALRVTAEGGAGSEPVNPGAVVVARMNRTTEDIDRK